MKLRVNETFETILDAVKNCKTPDQKVYLVGGAVRDLLLEKTIHDFDFVTSIESRALAKNLRKVLGGVGFALDDERGFNRVILNGGSKDEVIIDIAEFSGNDLEEDLHARDFTINAMAIDVDDMTVLIDPLGGKEDLQSGVLRVASMTSFASDPLRVLRAVRMMQAYDMGLDAKTSELLRVAVGDLERVSGERVRDELFNILNVHGYEDSFKILWYFGILSEIFPCVPLFDSDLTSEAHHVFDARLKQLSFLENLYLQIEMPELDELVINDDKNALSVIDQWRTELSASINLQITYGRCVRHLLVLLVLLLQKDVKEGPPSTLQVFIRDYKLSNDEADFLNRIEGFCQTDYGKVVNQRVWENTEIYDILKALKSATPGYVLIAISAIDFLKSKDADRDISKAVHNLKQLLTIWYEQGETILKPRLLMNGDEIIDYTGLKPGPIVGALLALLEKAQFLGDVKTIDDAKQLIDAYLKAL